MPDRSHPKCWKGDHYEHVECVDGFESGRECIESGCVEPAGTAWGPYFCPEHDVERLDRISASLESIASSLRSPTSVSGRPES
jgi:hypothetical protein